MKLVPKVTKPANAVRLKKALTANAGDWLIIKDDDTVEVISDAIVRTIFTIDRKDTPLRKSPENFTRVASPRYILKINGKEVKVGGQLGRILVGFSEADMGHGAFSSQIQRHLSELDAKSVTARLSDATKFGFVEAVKSEKDPSSTSGFLWKLTNNGREIARQIKKQESAAD